MNPRSRVSKYSPATSLESRELLLSAARAIQQSEALISARVSDRCYQELASYSQRQMPKEESRGTVERLMDHLILCLEGVVEPEQLQAALVQLERDIAARRVRVAIDFEDLLKGITITRQELWAILETELGGSQPGWWELERLVNTVFDQFLVGLATSYLRSQREQICAHESALAKWDEVVRSASHIRLKIPCREEYAKAVRLQAEAIARRVWDDEETVYDIVMAVGEVCDNAIEHGRSEMGIDVEYLMEAGRFRVMIQDYGPGFDPAGRGEEPPDLFSECGRGLFLMKNLMDQVEIDSSPGAGTRIVLTRNRHDS